MPGNRFICPSCERTLKTGRPVAAGKKIRCPACGTVFPVPGEQAEAGEPEVVEETDEAPGPARKPGKAFTARKPDPARKRRLKDEEEDQDDRPHRSRRKAKRTSPALVWGLVG